MKVTVKVYHQQIDEKFERWRHLVDPSGSWTKPRYVAGSAVSASTPGVETVLVNAAKVIASEAERLAPVAYAYPASRMSKRTTNQDRRPGRLRRSMRAFVWRIISGVVNVLAAQDVKAEDSYYARWVQRGTRAHHVGKGSRLRSGRKFGGLHPGSKADPFFRDAVARKRYEARKLIEAGVKELIEAGK